MRDKRFVAEHRGGPLKNTLEVAKDWAKGNASVGEARKASLDAIKVANEISDPASVAVARSVGHAVATAHMADHSLGAADYALKAVKMAGKPVDMERKWQTEQLPADLLELVLTARSIRSLKI